MASNRSNLVFCKGMRKLAAVHKTFLKHLWYSTDNANPPKPISNMRSASSKTRYDTLCRDVAFFLTWSIRRPYANTHKHEISHSLPQWKVNFSLRRQCQRQKLVSLLLPECTPQSLLPLAELWPAPTCCLLHTLPQNAMSRLYQNAYILHGSGKHWQQVTHISDLIC